MQPGGHIDPGEAPWEAAHRESEEETGLTLDIRDAGPRLIHLDVHDAAKGHTHLDLRYLLLAPDQDPRRPRARAPKHGGIAWDEAIALADAALAGSARGGPATTGGAGTGRAT